MDPEFAPAADSANEHFLLDDQVLLDFAPYNGQQLYFEEQLADFVLFPEMPDQLDPEDPGPTIGDEFIGETNADGSPAVTLTGNIRMETSGESQIRIEHLDFRMLTLLDCDVSVLNCNMHNSSGQWAGVAISNVTGTFEDCEIVTITAPSLQGA